MQFVHHPTSVADNPRPRACRQILTTRPTCSHARRTAECISLQRPTLLDELERPCFLHECTAPLCLAPKPFALNPTPQHVDPSPAPSPLSLLAFSALVQPMGHQPGHTSPRCSTTHNYQLSSALSELATCTHCHQHKCRTPATHDAACQHMNEPPSVRTFARMAFSVIPLGGAICWPTAQPPVDTRSLSFDCCFV